MTQPLLASAPSRESDSLPSGFLVLRQDPATREYVRVGLLERRNGGYLFRYSNRVAKDPGFEPLPGFPDRSRLYESSALFTTFANRVMTPRRDSYRHYLAMLGLEDIEPEPFEVLARTWGQRATDRIQLLPIPRVDDAGNVQTRFLVHGGAHVDPEGRALSAVRSGEALQLQAQPQNTEDRLAVLVLAPPTREKRELGYVPRPLAPFIHRLWGEGAELRVVADHVNPPDERLVSGQMRLLVRLMAHVGSGFDVRAALDGA